MEMQYFFLKQGTNQAIEQMTGMPIGRALATIALKPLIIGKKMKTIIGLVLPFHQQKTTILE